MSRSVKTAALSLDRMIRSALCNRSGTAAILFGICALPTIGVVGLGVDYWRGLSYKSRLDAAADSAAIAAITAAQTYYNANVGSNANSSSLNNAMVSAGQTQGAKVFYTNAGAAASLLSTAPTVTVTPPASQTITSTVKYSATMPMVFGKLFGSPQMALAGQTSSSLTMGSYIDFYLALDVSGSMGLPTSGPGQTTLAAHNTDDSSQYPTGCVFACHYSGSQGYSIARQYGVKLRVDSLGTAVQNLIATAKNTQTLTNQYRIGLYPFIVDAVQAAPLQNATDSSNWSTASSVAGSLGDQWLDSGNNSSHQDTDGTNIGAGGTHLGNVLTDINKHRGSIGDGTSPSKPKAFLFLVTDGADNEQVYPFNGSQPQRPTNVVQTCQYAQSLGVVISILYIPYVPIQNPNSSFANDEDDKVNAIIPYLPTDLQQCASKGFFFQANSDADITNAMQAMFAQALQAARLTL